MSRRPPRRVLTLAQAGALLGDELYTEFDATFDRYDREEATDFAVAFPSAELHPCPACGRTYGRHAFACWLTDTPARQAWRRRILAEATEPKRQTRKDAA